MPPRPIQRKKRPQKPKPTKAELFTRRLLLNVLACANQQLVTVRPDRRKHTNWQILFQRIAQPINQFIANSPTVAPSTILQAFHTLLLPYTVAHPTKKMIVCKGDQQRIKNAFHEAHTNYNCKSPIRSRHLNFSATLLSLSYTYVKLFEKIAEHYQAQRLSCEPELTLKPL